MLTALAQSIFQQANASPIGERLTGGIHFQQAPQGTASPWCTFRFTGTSTEEITGAPDNGLHTTQVQFHIGSTADDGGLQCVELMEQLSTDFHWQTLPVQGYSDVKMQRINFLPLGYIDEIWEGVVLFEATLEKE